MSEPTRDWMPYTLDALQIEEYLASYVLSFRRSWLRDWQGDGLMQGTLLTIQVRRATGIETDSDDLIREVKAAFAGLITQE
jgi:hypothetical protein